MTDARDSIIQLTRKAGGYVQIATKEENIKESEYRTVNNILEDLAKAQGKIDKLWFELWRMFKK